MKGTILDYSIPKNEGLISGEDGQRYTFTKNDWRSPGIPTRSRKIDFTINNGKASEIFDDILSNPNEKNQTIGMKKRGFIAVILLFVATLSIYYIYWLVQTKEEMNSLGAKIPSAWLLLIIPPYWLYRYGQGVSLVTKGKKPSLISRGDISPIWGACWAWGGFPWLQLEFNKIAAR